MSVSLILRAYSLVNFKIKSQRIFVAKNSSLKYGKYIFYSILQIEKKNVFASIFENIQKPYSLERLTNNILELDKFGVCMYFSLADSIFG